MATFNRNDNRLLTEAYDLQLLKESIPGMTLSQVSSNIDLLSESEAQYVCEVSERILNEFFGGMKNIMGAGKNALQGAGQAVGNAAKSAGQAVGNAAKGAVQGAKNVASGVGAAAQQVGSNVKDMYNTGNDAASSASFAKKAQGYVDQLKTELEDAQAKGLITFNGPIDQITLGEVVEELLVAAQGNQNFADSAQDKGFTGGAGKAFTQGRQQSQAAATTPAQQPAAPQRTAQNYGF